jgi:glucose dehydrogenase
MPLRAFTRAELLLTQRLQLEWPLLLLVLLGSGAFALSEGNALYLALTGLGVVINALALLRRSEFYVPRRLVNLAVLAIIAYFLWESWGGLIVRSLGHFLILIQLCKLFEQKRKATTPKSCCSRW